MSGIVLAPFRHVSCPKLDLSLPDLSSIPATVIFAVVLISYYMIISGVMYDVIRSPPPWGARRDELGNVIYENLVPYQLNAQYVVEGFTSGSVTCGAALALVCLSAGPSQLLATFKAHGVKVDGMKVLMFCVALCGAVFLCYATMISFLRQKMGGY